MANCLICEAPVPQRTCPICGTRLAHAGTVRAGAGQARVAVKAARRRVAAEESRGTDLTVSLRLVGLAEQAIREGSHGPAIDMAQAARRAVDIARVRAKLATDISAAADRIRRASEAGLATEPLEKRLVRARTAFEAGDYTAAAHWTKASSTESVDAQRQRQVQDQIARAEAYVRDARARGAAVDDAEAALGRARDAAKAGNFAKVNSFLRASRSAAEGGLRAARAAAVIIPLANDIASAKSRGADTSKAGDLLAQARAELRGGAYGRVSPIVQSARSALREALRASRRETAIRGLERAAKRIERSGGDVSRASGILAEAREAHAGQDDLGVMRLARDGLVAVREAAHLRRTRESIAAIEIDREDLVRLGLGTSDFDRAVADARLAVESGSTEEARRQIAAARRVAEEIRDRHYRETVRATIETLLVRAGGGSVDPGTAQAVLSEVEEAFAAGRTVDVQALVDQRLGAMVARAQRDAQERVTWLTDSIADLRRASVDVGNLEAHEAEARGAVDEARYDDALASVDAARESIDALRSGLAASAVQLVSQAGAAVDRARDEGATSGHAAEVLETARSALAAGRAVEAMEFGRIAISLAERASESAKGERVRAEDAARRNEGERVQAVQAQIETISRELDAVAIDAVVEVAEARRSLAAARDALEAARIDEAEAQTATAETLAGAVRERLEREAREAVQRAEQGVERAASRGIDLARQRSQLGEAIAAVSHGQPARALELARSVEEAVRQAEGAHTASERERHTVRTRKGEERLAHAIRLLQDLRGADIEIEGADEALGAAEADLHRGALDAVETRLSDIEATIKEITAELRNAAIGLISRARRHIARAQTLRINVEEATSILSSAEAYLERGEYDDAIEFGQVAEQRADAAMRAYEEGLESKEREDREQARALILRLRKLVDELAKADIEIVGSKDQLHLADEALEKRQYDQVREELSGLLAMAESLSEGLRKAAEDLVAMAEREIADSRARGIDAPRAESVLGNARDATRDGRYVEAIEYKKVIEDILADAERQPQWRSLEERFHALQSEVASMEASGTPMEAVKEILARASRDVEVRRADALSAALVQIEDALKAAKAQRTAGRMASLLRSIEAAESLGVDRREAERIRAEAKRAIDAGHVDALERLSTEVDALVERRHREAAREKADGLLQTLEAMLDEAGELGAAAVLDRLIKEARRAIAEGRPDDVEPLVARGRALLEAKRAEAYASRFGSKQRAVAETIATAERIGAAVPEAHKFLSDAEDAFRRSDFSHADLLLKQAEISANVQVQKFILNRYPKPTLALPLAGYQAGVWNRVVFSVANRGRLAARNLSITFSGNVEVKGIEPIPELAVDDQKYVEIGVWLRGEGDVPVDVVVAYQRPFDENRYEVRETFRLKVEESGTYLVEDVFLTHADGRLLAHESRKFREEIDEDIFSGMLTVLQDFVKDSFRQRSRVGLKRLDFGTSKILIERSPNTFLATVVVGDEPPLLPIYMVEVLQAVEARFGGVLQKWNGMLQELEGISDIIKPLILVTPSRTADLGQLSTSPVTATARALADANASGADVSDVERLLQEATASVESDLEGSWGLVRRAQDEVAAKIAQVKGRAEREVAETRVAVGELKNQGIDVSAAEVLLREADAAFAEARFDAAIEAAHTVRAFVERSRADVAEKKVESELARLVAQIREARAHGIDVHEAEAYLTRIQDAIQRRDPGRTEEYLRRARDSVDRARREAVSVQARDELAHLAETAREMDGAGVNTTALQGTIARAEAALSAGRIREVEAILESARGDVHDQIRDLLTDRYPRLYFALGTTGLEANAWNRVALQIENKGDWPAVDLEVLVLGDLDVAGPTRIDRLAAREAKTIQLGLRPHAQGAFTMDTEVRYRRPLDQAHYQATDSATVRVERPGTYPVNEALLFAVNGKLVAREARLFASETADDPVDAIGDILRRMPEGTGLRRMRLHDRSLVVERGATGGLVVILSSDEPSLLPLFLVDVLGEIEDGYGPRLRSWTQGSTAPGGVPSLLRKLVFVSAAPDAAPGPLEGHPLSRVPMLVTHGGLTGDGGRNFYEWAREAIEQHPFPEAVAFIRELKSRLELPFQDLNRQLQDAVRESREEGGVEVTDDQLQKYVVFVQDVLAAVMQAKARAGIERHWPIKRLAVKPDASLGFEAVTALRKIIVGQSLAKELDIVEPGGTWSGMIELLLRNQDAWKIKKGIDRGEYAVGIEGQRVRIDPSMVSFTETLPDTAIMEPFRGGVVYIDTQLTPDLLAEGYARELINVVRDLRKELGVRDEDEIRMLIRGSETLQEMLHPWHDTILRETRSTAIDFTDNALRGGPVVEVSMGEETFVVSVRPAEALAAANKR